MNPASLLAFRPRGLVNFVIVLLIYRFGDTLAERLAHPDDLRSESDWLESFRTTNLPALRRREEHLFRLMDSWAEKQKQPKPAHKSWLRAIDPLMVSLCSNCIAMVQLQAHDTVFPWGTPQFRRDRAEARKNLQELKSHYKWVSEKIESEIQKYEAFLLKPTLPSVPEPEVSMLSV